MTHLFPDVALVIFGLFYLYTSVVSFHNPVAFARVLSLEATGRSGQVEIRAQYSGFFAAAAMSQFAPFVGLLAQETAFFIALTIFGGLILGRLAAFSFQSGTEALTTTIRWLYLIDGAGAAAAFLALILLDAQPNLTG